MKIEIDDMAVNGLVLDLMAEVIKAQMKEIVDDDTVYIFKEDTKYYNKLKKAARTVHNYYSINGEKL